ncbi:MAG: hypothetical protein IPK23_12335 [Rhizobiales bacterium]|nr:hypothetical protein [Hyphomicrobiales bacterium]
MVSNAISKGFLQDRVDKKFGYLNHPEKDEESKLHPKITYISGYYQSALPFLIERELKKIAAVTKREFSVLVTSPSHFCVKIAEALSSKGFTVNFKAEDDDQSTNLAFDALDTLSKTNNGKNNFGWRLLSPF